MALPDVSVNVTPLLHSCSTIRTLNLRFLTTLELGVPLEVPGVNVALRTPRTRMPVHVPQRRASSSPSDQWLLLLAIEVLRILHNNSAQVLQVVLDLDPLRIL